MIPPHRLPPEADRRPLGCALCVASALVVLFVIAALLLY